MVVVGPGVGGRGKVEGLRGQHQLRSQLVATATHEELLGSRMRGDREMVTSDSAWMVRGQ